MRGIQVFFERSFAPLQMPFFRSLSWYRIPIEGADCARQRIKGKKQGDEGATGGTVEVDVYVAQRRKNISFDRLPLSTSTKKTTITHPGRKTPALLLCVLLFAILAASRVAQAQQSNNDDLSDTPETESEADSRGKGVAAAAAAGAVAAPTPSPSSSTEPDDGVEEGVPAGEMAPASTLTGENGTSSSSEVRLEFEVEAPLPPTPSPRAGKKTKAINSTHETEPETEIDDDDGSDGSLRYAPALGAALARFADLPRDRVAIGLATGSSSSNGNSTGKCGARSQSKRVKRTRKRGTCSSFEATMRLNDGEEADNVRQAFASGDVSGFVEALRRATTPPGLSTASNNSSSPSVASVESVSKVSTSTSAAASTVLVEPTPYNVLFTSIDGTPLAAATAGREVVTDGSGPDKKPLGGGAIAGIVIGVLGGVLAVFALLLAGVAAVRRRREKRAFAAKRAAGSGVGVGA